MTALSASTRSANWEFLWRNFETCEFHRVVSKKFSTASDDELTVLLRFHRPDGVSDSAEIEFRATVDEWLGQVEILYVAWLCGYVPDPVKQNQTTSLRRMLERKPLRAYYERHYPIALPWLFRLHLEGALRIDPVEQVQAAGAFERFTVIYERFRSDENLGEFLDFLDGFYYGSEKSPVDIRTVVAAFESPTRVTDALSRPEHSLNSLDRGIAGLVRFLTFSEDLDTLLQLCRTMPLVQSTFWFFYVYWFTEFKTDVSAESARAIDNIVATIVEADPSTRGLHRLAAKEHGAELKLILQRLTGSEYARPLYNEVRQIVSRNPERVDTSAKEWVKRFGKKVDQIHPKRDKRVVAPTVKASRKAKARSETTAQTKGRVRRRPTATRKRRTKRKM